MPEVTPSDFLQAAADGGNFSGMLAGLSKYLNAQENVDNYLRQTPLSEVNELANLMVSFFASEAYDYARAILTKFALEILIKLTSCSPDACIYFSTVLQVQVVIQLLNRQDYFHFWEEVNCLLHHMLVCGKPDIRQLISTRYLQKVRFSNKFAASNAFLLLKSLSRSDLLNPALCYDIETLIEQIWVSYVEKKQEKEK